MATFRSADRQDQLLLEEVLKAHHPEFIEYKVDIGLYYAHATRDKDTGEPKGPALRANRLQAADYTVKPHNHEQRVKGAPDATINVDGDNWESWTRERQRQILDEAVRELELVWEKDGAAVQLDDQGRPKLRKSVPDLTVKVWYDVARRGGDQATAVMALRTLDRDFVQTYLEFPEEALAAT